MDEPTLEYFQQSIQRSEPEQRGELFQAFAGWIKQERNDEPSWLRFLSVLNEFGAKDDKQAGLLELENWLEQHPENEALRVRLLAVLKTIGSYSQVKKWIAATREWLALHGENAAVRIAYLRLLDRAGDSSQCVEAIDETLQNLPASGLDSALLQTLLAFVRRKGTPEQAQALFNAAESLLEQHPTNENLRAAYLRAVSDCDDPSRKARAAEATSRYLESSPDMSTWEMYLSLLHSTGPEELLHAEMNRAEKWMQDKPHSANLRAMLLRLVSERGTRVETAATIDETLAWLKENPEDVNVRAAYLSLVTRYGDTTQLAAGLEMVVDWLIEHPSRNDILSRYQMLVCKRKVESEYERAVGLADIWLADNPTQDSRYGHILAGKAVVLFRMGRYQEAIPLFRKAFSLEYRQFYAQILYGWALYSYGEKEKALAQLKSLLRYRGEYAPEKIFCEIGRMYSLEGDFHQAMIYLNRAVETCDSFYTGYIELGRALLAEGHPKSAIRYLISARARLPERTDDETRQEINCLLEQAATKALRP